MALRHEQQRRTYLPYTRGIPSKRLRIGSLVLSPGNPTGGLEDKRFEFKEGVSEDEYWAAIEEDWTGEPEIDAPCSLNFEASKEWTLSAAVGNVIHGEADRHGSNYTTIEGKKGRRFEVQKPMKFFREEVFEQPDVQEWIRKQLSISAKTRLKNKFTKGDHWTAPDIWLVTGVQLITGGKVTSGASRGGGQGGGVNLDPGMLHGVPTGQSVASVHAGSGNAVEANQEYGHKDERVWAAQFMRLIVEFGKPSGEGVTSTPTGPTLIPRKSMTVTLKELEDLGANAVRDDESDGSETEEEGSTDTEEPGELVAEIIGLDGVYERESEELKPDIRSKEIEVSDRLSIGEIDWERYEEYSKYWDKLHESENF